MTVDFEITMPKHVKSLLKMMAILEDKDENELANELIREGVRRFLNIK